MGPVITSLSTGKAMCILMLLPHEMREVSLQKSALEASTFVGTDCFDLLPSLFLLALLTTKT